MPLGNAFAMRGCTLSITVFGQRVHFKWHPHKCQTQGFLAEHCIVTRCSMLITSPVSGVNVFDQSMRFSSNFTSKTWLCVSEPTCTIPGPRNQESKMEFSYHSCLYLHLCFSCFDMSKCVVWKRHKVRLLGCEALWLAIGTCWSA